MKTLVFGSLNRDIVYHVSHIVRPGETVPAESVEIDAGGKGLNQAIALSRAGADTYFAGCIGNDGDFLEELLIKSHVNTDHLQRKDMPSGSAVIQVDDSGQNSIVLYGGSNQSISKEQIDETLASFAPGDLLLMQNEISNGRILLEKAHAIGMKIAVNPSPISDDLLSWPLELADYLILNETEAEAITRVSELPEMIAQLQKKFPQTNVVLTVGENGAYSLWNGTMLYQPAFKTEVVDTTGAGDTFTGFYLHSLSRGKSEKTALCEATRAASIAVSRKGAAQSIPFRAEVFISTFPSPFFEML